MIHQNHDQLLKFQSARWSKVGVPTKYPKMGVLGGLELNFLEGAEVEEVTRCFLEGGD